MSISRLEIFKVTADGEIYLIFAGVRRAVSASKDALEELSLATAIKSWISVREASGYGMNNWAK